AAAPPAGRDLLRRLRPRHAHRGRRAPSGRGRLRRLRRGRGQAPLPRHHGGPDDARLLRAGLRRLKTPIRRRVESFRSARCQKLTVNASAVPPWQVRMIEASMDNEFLTSLRRLSDDELVAKVKHLVSRERVTTSELVAHLAELDTRDIHLRQGYGSLFAYCRDVLALSEHEAYNRIEVARAARRFPVILEMLAEGAVSLTSVRLLAPHLTRKNHRSVLASARGKRKIDVEEIVARLAPRPDVAGKVRKLPT